jgi:hypothetical protein
MSMFSKMTNMVRPGSVKNAADARFDSTLRPICFDLPLKVSKAAGKAVGPQKFKRYEHILYLGAQLSRLVYCDTGIMWNVIEKSLGMSNDIVNKVITAYDKEFAGKRRSASTAPGAEGGRPMESYSLVVAKPGDAKYATYVSSPDDMTCLFLNASKVRSNPNSILTSNDVFISFKGSSTMDNFKHDLMSQISASDLGGLVKSTGVVVQGERNLVTGAFVKPLVTAWAALMGALTEHVKNGGTRLFLCGHSLGGAYCTLFAFILAEGKVSGTIPIMSKVKSIHILSYGAPCIVSDTARNTFNRHLESGLMTIDRVVSQKVAARSAATQLLVGGIAGPNDVIPTIPAGFSHPGFRPLATNIMPEAGGRPYSMDNIRKFYGVETTTRYRDSATWPFTERLELGDWKNSKDLDALVKGLTGVAPPANEDPAAVVANDPKPLVGGLGKQKGIYSAATKNHIPDFVSVAGSNWAAGFAHAEYLGMFFAGGFRLPGMKNPGYGSRIAYFGLANSGVSLSYKAVGALPSWPAELAKMPADETGEAEDPKPVAGGRRVSRVSRVSRRERKNRKQRKTRRL